MTKKTNKTYCALGLAAVAVSLASTAHADINYAISDGGLQTVTSITLDGKTLSGVLAGGIKLTSSSGSFVSVCTDLFNTVYEGSTYIYKPTAITSSSTGNNPNWGAGNATTLADITSSSAAIANAAKLFKAGYTELQNISSAQNILDEKTALQLAIWSVLYNTKDDGSLLTGNNVRFSFTDGSDTAVVTDYNIWLGNIINASANASVQLLVPDPYTAQNNGVNNTGGRDGMAPQGMLQLTPVPEASTVVAGGLLLLPFALCSLKAFRKSRV